MKVACWSCKHYNQRSYLYSTGKKNVSGGLAWYQGWSKHRCNLEQEDKYPKSCDYETLEKYKPKPVEKKPIVATRILTKEMTELARWHNDDCGKLNGKKRCTCACGWAKVSGKYGMSWLKFIKIYGWWKAIKAECI